jgi:RNA polymerase sigma-70 factor (ECF subfamily)
MLAEAHDLYYTRLYRYAWNRLGDEAASEDVASEVFLRLLVKLRAGRPPHTSLPGWLFGAAAHLVVDTIRRGARERLRVSEAWSLGNSAEAEAEAGLLAARFRVALGRLTPDQRQVLRLRFGRGLPLEATATVMGRSVSAVKALQSRATAALRAALRDWG